MANNPDVRIRLSAEGVQEVVNALKQVQTQSQKTAKETEKVGGGFDAVTKGIEAMRGGVAALSGVIATLGGIGLAKQLADSAEQLGRASQQTGIAVEELSRLSFAAKSVRVEAEALYDSLNDFAEKMFDAAAGSGDGADALKAMGFSADYAKKNINNLPKILGDIADKFVNYKDGAAKTALAVKLFGDSGKALVPLLSQGSAGMRELMAESDKLGATIREDTVKEAIKFNTELAKLTEAAKGFAQTILGPTMGALNQLIDKFKAARAEGATVAESVFGALATSNDKKNLQEARAELEKLMQTKADVESGKNFFGIKGSASSILMGQITLAKKAVADLEKAEAEAAKTLGGFGKETYAANAKKTDAPDLSLGKDAENKAKADQARAAAIAAATERELSLLRLRNAMTDSAQRAEYEDSLVSLTKYHADRLARIEAENAKELNVAKQKLAAAQAIALTADATDADKINKEASIKAASDAITSVEVQNAQRVKEAERAKYTELKALNEERRQVELQQMQASGQREKAAIAALNDEIQKYEELLKKIGEVSEADIERLTGAQRAKGMGRINFDNAKEAGTKKLNTIDEKKAGIERDLSTGKLWGYEAEAQILELERQRIPVLEEMYAKMKAAAEQSKDPALIEQARQMSIAIEDAKAKTDEYGQAMANLKQTGFDAAVQGFSTFLSDITSGNKSIADSFQSLAGSVVQALQQMLIKMIAVKAMQAAFGMFGIPVPAGAVAAATGGHITGPGTGTSDSIPAWLSNGEFVVRAAAVQAVGLDALHEINRKGRLPTARVSGFSAAHVSKYADGGLVGSIADATGGGSTQVSIGLEEGLVLKKLSSPEGQRVLVEALGQNRRAVRQIIG